MEVASTVKNSLKTNRIQSSFECDPAALDFVLGLCVLGTAQLRADAAECLSPPKGRVPQVYAPIETVPKTRTGRDRSESVDDVQWELGSDLKRERLFRLLDRQQAWYDAGQQAAAAAEQLLSLCEHHQQQWLPSPQNQPAQLTTQ